MIPYVFPSRRLWAALLFVLLIDSSPVAAQNARERFWLAGRYDGNRVVIYFNAVKFGSPAPPNPVKIASPVAQGFLTPEALPARYIARLQHGPDAEHFRVGDHYDLLAGGNEVATVTLTTLVGSEGDEGVGNDSYIGALGTLDDHDGMLNASSYYVVRRHAESPGGTLQPRPNPLAGYVGLVNEPVRFDVQAQIVPLLNQRWKTATASPAFTTQAFTLFDGSLRYYVRAQWRPGDEPRGDPTHVLGAWLTRSPKLHMMAVERQTSNYGFEYALPTLHNVVDLGHGKVGMIVSLAGEDSAWLELVEYRDGVALAQMRRLQIIGSAE